MGNVSGIVSASLNGGPGLTCVESPFKRYEALATHKSTSAFAKAARRSGRRLGPSRANCLVAQADAGTRFGADPEDYDYNTEDEAR